MLLSRTQYNPQQRSFPVPIVPVALLLILITLSMASALSIAWEGEENRPIALLVGDSFTGNYRFEEGERLQDLMEEESDGVWQVMNHAKPGARTLDIFMQVHQGLWLQPRVDAVVLPLQVSKLMPGESPVRMDKRGDNLKWWNVDFKSPLWLSFNDEYRKKVLIHKIGLLFGFLDLGEFLFVREFQSPRERKEMRENSSRRQEKIAAKIEKIEEHWETTSIDKDAVYATRAAQDLAFLVAELNTRSIPLLIVLVPAGNPEITGRDFSASAQMHLKEAAEATRSWCKDQGVPVVDLVDTLPGEAYDDFSHLKGVSGNKMISRAAAQWLAVQRH